MSHTDTETVVVEITAYDETPQEEHIRSIHRAAQGRHFSYELREAAPDVAGWFWDRAQLVYEHATSRLREAGMGSPWDSMAHMLHCLEGANIDPDHKGSISVVPLVDYETRLAGELVAVVYVRRDDAAALVMLATKAEHGEDGDVAGCNLWIPGGVTDRVAEVETTGVAGYHEDECLEWDGKEWSWDLPSPQIERVEIPEAGAEAPRWPFNFADVAAALADARKAGEAIQLNWPAPKLRHGLGTEKTWQKTWEERERRAVLDTRAALSEAGVQGHVFAEAKAVPRDEVIAVTLW